MDINDLFSNNRSSRTSNMAFSFYGAFNGPMAIHLENILFHGGKKFETVTEFNFFIKLFCLKRHFD